MKTKTERLIDEFQVYLVDLSHENVEQRQRFVAQINFIFWNRKWGQKYAHPLQRPPRAQFPFYEKMRTLRLAKDEKNALQRQFI